MSFPGFSKSYLLEPCLEQQQQSLFTYLFSLSGMRLHAGATYTQCNTKPQGTQQDS